MGSAFNRLMGLSSITYKTDASYTFGFCQCTNESALSRNLPLTQLELWYAYIGLYSSKKRVILIFYKFFYLTPQGHQAWIASYVDRIDTWLPWDSSGSLISCNSMLTLHPCECSCILSSRNEACHPACCTLTMCLTKRQ